MVLKADRRQICADGRDVAVVTVEVQDAKGHVVPDACPMLTLSLEGNGLILGVGNGDPAYLGEDHPQAQDCHQFQILAFNGLAQVLIQSGKTPAQLILNCAGGNLKSGSIVLNTQNE